MFKQLGDETILRAWESCFCKRVFDSKQFPWYPRKSPWKYQAIHVMRWFPVHTGAMITTAVPHRKEMTGSLHNVHGYKKVNSGQIIPPFV